MAEKRSKEPTKKYPEKSDDRRAFGLEAEQIALDYLEKKGFRLMARNYRTSFGEIDLIGMLDGRIVFVEVRARRSRSFGTPQESITERKKRTLRRVALSFLHTETKNLPPNAGLRFDVIAVRRDPQGKDTIEHLPAAF
ncbi:MAG: putative endonuclease distantly related to archaeal Holliday junction resolvase [Candidatus Carbobacillus altaicus]|uniref:UPF0102 protein BSOLF_0943 n=1 Tax=Candidatus Carbonibacillus altaicus TaxID=2163959 RepID=A0A2R6Y507_9BACL|nr:MAG: putative endonuclease distantly related to archaeal Holliday junction resolvase [Candidatus Carbobacillus altaicus]